MSRIRVWASAGLMVAACSATPGSMGATGEATETGGTTASGTSGTSASAGATTSMGPTSSTTASSGGSETGGSFDPWAACAAVRSREECERLWFDPTGEYVCTWGEIVTVEVDAGECMLGTPEIGCHATYQLGKNECTFAEGPNMCLTPPFDVVQAHREIAGTTFLWRRLPGGCGMPVQRAGEPAWESCPSEEFGDVPDFCYCRCGGVPDGGTGTGTGTSGP